MTPEATNEAGKMIRFLKVTGESLSPLFQDGDYVLVAKFPFLLRRIRPGDIVVFRQVDYGTLIKRVERLSPDGDELFVKGTHELSTDSRRFGAVHRSDLIGKVIWSIHKKRLQS
jgi:nickel-type superoxide dismutase maturation protease